MGDLGLGSSSTRRERTWGGSHHLVGQSLSLPPPSPPRGDATYWILVEEGARGCGRGLGVALGRRPGGVGRCRYHRGVLQLGHGAAARRMGCGCRFFFSLAPSAATLVCSWWVVAEATAANCSDLRFLQDWRYGLACTSFILVREKVLYQIMLRSVLVCTQGERRKDLVLVLFPLS